MRSLFVEVNFVGGCELCHDDIVLRNYVFKGKRNVGGDQLCLPQSVCIILIPDVLLNKHLPVAACLRQQTIHHLVVPKEVDVVVKVFKLGSNSHDEIISLRRGLTEHHKCVLALTVDQILSNIVNVVKELKQIDSLILLRQVGYSSYPQRPYIICTI